MQFNIEKSNLLENLSKVSRAITNKSSVEALKGVLIQVQNNQLVLLGSDMDLSILSFGQCEVIIPGSALIDAKVLLEIIRKMPSGVITIFKNTENNLLDITSGKCNFNICLMNEADYPELPKLDQGTELIVQTDQFRKMIDKVSFAIAQDETRPILQGILCEVKDSKLRLVALDGYRFAYADTIISNNLDISAVIDGKSLNNISKLLEGTGEMKIYFHPNHLVMKVNNLAIYSRLLEGKYVNYESLLPQTSKLNVKLNVIEFLNAIERSVLIASQNGESSSLILKIQKDGLVDTLTILSKSKKGKSTEDLMIEFEGEEGEKEFEIAFNGKYLLDMLSHMDAEKALLKFTKPDTPCVCQPVDSEESKYLILPIRLKKN
ncbi:DNA polymerase III subunit beta [uncultured Clostridium sp.]|uniref:DNA polymerase III subunit beta n=1 Tax=uncultured Clostridium sp. TaxID=59620 RepID=UPI0028ED9353|nr:DNA polymerase III subunit beta [uncultured Clostridium sp.]